MCVEYVKYPDKIPTDPEASVDAEWDNEYDEQVQFVE